MTPLECLWYVVLYAYASFGVGYWIRRVIEAVKSKGERNDA